MKTWRVILLQLALLPFSFGQHVYVPNFVEHPAHADLGVMSPERNLLGDGLVLTGVGEQTIHDAARGCAVIEPSLGAVARQNRAEHAAVPKARVVWTD